MKRSRSILIICLVTLVLLVVSYSLVSSGVGASPAFEVQGETMPNPIPPSGNERDIALASPGPNPNEHTVAPPSPAELKAALTTLSPGPAYLVLPPAAFTSDGFDPDGFFMYFYGGYFEGTVSSGACVLAPIDLPAGATITALEARLDDANASAYEWFDLYRINLATGVAEEIASVSSPAGTTGGVVALVDDTISSPVVSDMYAYQLCTCTREDIFVYGARIGYSFGAHLPSVMKGHTP